MNQILAWDGSAETWTEDESLKPSEHHQLVVLLLKRCLVLARKRYSLRAPRRLLKRMLNNTWCFCNWKLEFFQSLILKTSWMTFFRQTDDWRDHGRLEYQIRCSVTALTLCMERATERNTRATAQHSSVKTKRDEQAEEFEVVDDFRGQAPHGNCKVSSVVDKSRIT